jgi:RimJ/RimL family protein N-acetyltransferase
MTITIREARPDDAGQMIRLIKEVVAEPDINIPLTPDEFDIGVEEEVEIIEEYARSDNSIFLVAEDNGSIVGLLNLKGGHRRANRHATTLGMSIHRDYRNQGLGTRMMRQAVQWASENPIVKRIELQVYVRNTPAIHLYENFGFRIEGQRRHVFFQNGEYMDDLIMGLLLD